MNRITWKPDPSVLYGQLTNIHDSSVVKMVQFADGSWCLCSNQDGILMDLPDLNKKDPPEIVDQILDGGVDDLNLGSEEW